MKIGLVDVDGHAKKKKWGATIYPNLALCKIARYHKQMGDEVEWASTLIHYDKVYMSKVFNFTPDILDVYNADEVIKGGTGFDINSSLPEEIDMLQPDYSIYPNLPKDTAYGFLTRGCPNKCPWCVVPKKEGKIRPYMDIDEIAIEGRNNIVLFDNNILAAGDYAIEQFEKIIERGYRVDFNQAIDARLVTPRFAELMAKCKWIGRLIRFGCDSHAQIKECDRAIDMVSSYGYTGGFFLYCMLTSDFNESYSRISHWHDRVVEIRKIRKTQERLHKTNLVFPHAQPYLNPFGHNCPPQWQKDLTHWTNNRSLFFCTTFEEFEPRHGFKCSEYFK